MDVGEWRGTATELLRKLNLVASDEIVRHRSWPKLPHTLSGHLKRVAPALRGFGVEVQLGSREGKLGRRIIGVRWNPEKERPKRQQRQPEGEADASDAADAPLQDSADEEREVWDF